MSRKITNYPQNGHHNGSSYALTIDLRIWPNHIPENLVYIKLPQYTHPEESGLREGGGGAIGTTFRKWSHLTAALGNYAYFPNIDNYEQGRFVPQTFGMSQTKGGDYEEKKKLLLDG